MIDGIAAGKYNRVMLGKVNTLLAKLLGGHSLHLNEVPEIYLNVRPARQLEVWRFLILGFGLGYQDGFNARFQGIIIGVY
jgi:hypothetical protein